ncbi:hypothetical protein HOY81_26455 [Streptomyces sp. JJ36]|nr:hypothetical protein [Streptomyces sp. JJ36]
MPAGAPTASGTVPGSGPPGTGKPAGVPAAKPDHLLFTVRHSGDPRTDGTYALQCHPAAGGHPAPQAACAALDAAAHGGADPFAPVPSGAHCAMIHGGPATAQVRGIWHGRPVFARFDRSDGCAMSRWDALVPALPAIR